MKKNANTLPPIPVTPEQRKALEQYANSVESSMARIVRLAIGEYLAKYNQAQGNDDS